jgi:hypothetical protein
MLYLLRGTSPAARKVPERVRRLERVRILTFARGLMKKSDRHFESAGHSLSAR